MSNDDLITVSAGQLDQMSDHLTSTHTRMTQGFEALSAELLRGISDWGEGTDSRAAYDSFKQRVDALFGDMFAAVSRMPPLVRQAAEESRSGEQRRAAMWAG